MFWKRATGYNVGVLSILVCAVFLVSATKAVPRTMKQAQQPAPASPTAAQRALLDQYCVTCHNQQLKTAGLLLDTADLNDIPGGGASWEKSCSPCPRCRR